MDRFSDQSKPQCTNHHLEAVHLPELVPQWLCVCVHQQEEGISVNGEYTRVWKLPGNNTPAGSAATSGNNCVIELSLCWFLSGIFPQKTILWREQYSLVSRRQDGERGSKSLLEEGDEGGVEGAEQGGQVCHPCLALYCPLEFHCCSEHSVFPLSTLPSFMLSEQSSRTTWWEDEAKIRFKPDLLATPC